MRVSIRLLLLVGLLLGVEVASQADERPLVLVDLYVTDERRVCPNGYQSVSNGQSRCPELSYEMIREWEADEQITAVTSQVPPEEVSLGSLRTAIENYARRCPRRSPCTDPQNDRRKAVILVFQFNLLNPKGVPLSFMRTTDDLRMIPPYPVTTGQLSTCGRWINHQRADAFLPNYRVKWILKAGTDPAWQWEFRTKNQQTHDEQPRVLANLPALCIR